MTERKQDKPGLQYRPASIVRVSLSLKKGSGKMEDVRALLIAVVMQLRESSQGKDFAISCMEHDREQNFKW